MQRVDPYGLVGQILDGQFRVDAPIGEGGCSVVYKGYHIGLDAPVAIKCLKLQQQLGTAFVQAFEQRFRDESKIQYRLSQGSLHIIRTLGAGTTIAPATSALVPYMVLEWLEGFTLSEQLRARRERGERGRPLPEVVRILDPVAEAMAFAHSLGVVHRDLNPSNLFVVVHPDGTQRLKVVDFGIAKVVSEHALQLARRAATLGSIRMFTPAYGAPEQFSETFGAVSTATDVYAFALLLVEMLIDRPAVDGETLVDYMERATDAIVRPTPWSLGCTTIGESVEAAIARALSVEADRRPPDIGAFWGLLKNAIQQDEERNKRRSSQPPASLLPPGPTTKKGTLILRPDANPFADTPTSSSIFAESTSSQGRTDALSGRSGTLQMSVVPSQPPPPAPPPPSIPPTSPTPGHQGTLHMQAHPGHAQLAPPSRSPADPFAPTQTGEPKTGASPLSFTVQPNQDLLPPELRAAVDKGWPAAQPQQPPPQPRVVPAIEQTLRAGDAPPQLAGRPRAPELAVAPPSALRPGVVMAIVGFLLLIAAAGLVFHFVTS